MLSADERQKSINRLAVAILGSIAAAVVTAALLAGLWYFLRGRRDKRTPETPQTITWSTSHRFPVLHATAQMRPSRDRDSRLHALSLQK